MMRHEDLTVPHNLIPYLMKHNNHLPKQRQHFTKLFDDTELVTPLTNIIAQHITRLVAK